MNAQLAAPYRAWSASVQRSFTLGTEPVDALAYVSLVLESELRRRSSTALIA